MSALIRTADLQQRKEISIAKFLQQDLSEFQLMLLLYTTGATPRVYPVVYSETRSIVVAETEGLILDVQRKVLESEESAILSVWKCAALVHVRLKFGFWLDDGITAKNIVRELYTPPKEPHAWFPLLDGAEFNRLCKESETPFRMSKGQF